jgi:hypothetical protein
MKRIVLMTLATIMLVASCKKDKDSIENPDEIIDVQKISLKTIEPSFKSDFSIKTGGQTSIDLSKHTYLEYGVCFGEDANPTINDNFVFSTVSSGGEYESIIDEKYIELYNTIYIKAYVKNLTSGSIKYGDQVIANSGTTPQDTVVDDTRFINGKYVGRHFFNIATNILDQLSAQLPVDPVTGEPVDLTEGFADTLDIRVVDGIVKVNSYWLNKIIDGVIPANNTIKIPETKFDVLNLGASVQVEDASIATNKNIVFTSASIGSATTFELRLKANKIGTFAIPLNFTTTGVFTKIAN